MINSYAICKKQQESEDLAYLVEMFLAGTPVIPDQSSAPIANKTGEKSDAHIHQRNSNQFQKLRSKARTEGLKHYSGKPCSVCQARIRFVSNDTCTACSKRHGKISQDKKGGAV